MRLTFEQRYKDLIGLHWEQLIKARDKAENLDMRCTTLGQSSRATFNAHAGFESIDDAVKATKILYKSKRRALLQIGDIYAVANRYGVITYNLPSEMAIGKFNLSMYSILDSKPFLEKIGAVHDGYSRLDRVYSYANCVVVR